MPVSYIPLFAAILLPVFPSSWRMLIAAGCGAILLLLASFFLCIHWPSVYQDGADPWRQLGCLLSVMMGGAAAAGSAGVAAFRIAGRARGWLWARMPRVLLPVAAIYFGVGLVLWVAFAQLLY
ncbi:MAG: hypothetical protein AAGE80_09460 [Pseudomonadota bacterium]